MEQLRRCWSSELRRGITDLSIEIQSHEYTLENEVPAEFYMTNAYKFVLRLTNYRESIYGDLNNNAAEKEAEIIFCMEVLDSVTLLQAPAPEPSKKILAGDTLVTINERDLTSPVTMRVRWNESNYSKKAKLTDAAIIANIVEHHQQRQSPGNNKASSHDKLIDSSAILALATASTIAQPAATTTTTTTSRSWSKSPPISSPAQLTKSPTSMTMTPPLPPPPQGLSSKSEREIDAAFMKQQLEKMNAQNFEYFRLRITCYVRYKRTAAAGFPRSFENYGFNSSSHAGAVATSGSSIATIGGVPISPTSLASSSLIDGSRLVLIPIVSKISAPFKVFSKKAHGKKKRKADSR